MNSGINSLSQIGAELWLVMSAALFLTAVLGFITGVYYAKTAPQVALKRAEQNSARFLAAVFRSLELAQQACEQLRRSECVLLSQEQASQLEARQKSLLASFTSVLGRRLSDGSLPVSADKPPKRSRKDRAALQNLEWSREPKDRSTSLPNRAAFDKNLENLLSACERSGLRSGLLLMRMDRFDQLVERLGVESANRLLGRLSSVALRELRDEDLVCRLNDDTLAVLIRETTTECGPQLAHTIRDSVRHHAFRVEATGPEVFVTASFGFSIAAPEDSSDAVLGRAVDAIEKSQSAGRNQLHAFAGAELVHWAAD